MNLRRLFRLGKSFTPSRTMDECDVLHYAKTNCAPTGCGVADIRRCIRLRLPGLSGRSTHRRRHGGRTGGCGQHGAGQPLFRSAGQPARWQCMQLAALRRFELPMQSPLTATHRCGITPQRLRRDGQFLHSADSLCPGQRAAPGPLSPGSHPAGLHAAISAAARLCTKKCLWERSLTAISDSQIQRVAIRSTQSASETPPTCLLCKAHGILPFKLG